MKTVKAIWFGSTSPGLPIYEMQDGTIRIPFFKKEDGVHFWMSEAELIKGLTDKKIIDQFRIPFIETMRFIDAEKLRRKTTILTPEGVELPLNIVKD